MTRNDTQMAALADNLIEDEAERDGLLAKPTCFIIIGSPGVGKTTLAKRISDSWKCVLIDDTYLLNTHIMNETAEGIELLDILSEGESLSEDLVLRLILARINSLDVEHYGYVLSCLPFISESMQIHEQIELIKNLKLTPDFIIKITCADGDLIQRLSGLKQNPMTGQYYTRDQLKNPNSKKENDMDQEMDSDKEESEEEELTADIIDQLVWTPESLLENLRNKISLYKSNAIPPLKEYETDHNALYLLELDGNSEPEDLHLIVTARLESMPVKYVSVPVLLQHSDDREVPEGLSGTDLLRVMASDSTVAPGFRWRWSRWGQSCPVALKEGRVIPGKPEFSVGFQDKLYILSSQERYKKFVTNPRKYLLPPMPRRPCRVSIIGHTQTGKTSLCKLVAQHYDAVVLDIEELLNPALAKAEEEKLNKIKKETTEAAIEKIKMEREMDDEESLVTEDDPEVQAMVLSAIEEAKQSQVSPFDIYGEMVKKNSRRIEGMDSDNAEGSSWVLDNFPNTYSQMESIELVKVLPEMIFYLKGPHERAETVAQQNKLENGSSDSPELSDSKLQNQQSDEEWKKIECLSSVPAFTLETHQKNLEALLQELLEQMEKPFQHMSYELSDLDLEEEEEDMKALREFEALEEDSSEENDEEDEDNEDVPSKRPLGETKHFCPVVLKNHNVLWPCTDEIVAKYRDRIYYFSSQEAKESFLQNPSLFVAQTEPLKPPALRIFMLGPRGSGKTTNGKWLAQKLGLFHIHFKEQLQMMLMAKTKKKVPLTEDLVSLEDDLGDLEARIKEARGEDETEEEKVSEPEVELTEDEITIKGYLTEGLPVTPQILEKFLAPYWNQEPYRSTGFVLEGFPWDPEEVNYISQQHLFPDIVVNLEVDVVTIQDRLMPSCLEKWRELYNSREARLKLLLDLNREKREESISKRRAELMAEKGLDEEKIKIREGSEEDSEEEIEESEDDMEAKLEEEFPVEDYSEFESMETETEAAQRIEMKLEEQFSADEANLQVLMEVLSENNIPKVEIDASTKVQIVQVQLLSKIQPLLTNRESLFQQPQSISFNLAQKLLLSSYKFHGAFGCWDPVQLYKNIGQIQPLLWPLNKAYPVLLNRYIYFFASKENCQTFMQNPLKYLRQPKPIAALRIRIAIIGPPKSGKTTVAQTLADKYGIARISVGNAMRMVLRNQKNTVLAVQMKRYLTEGLIVPDELAIQCLEVALMSSDCNTRGYVIDGFPMTLKQAELMVSRRTIPTIIAEIQLDSVEVLRKYLVDKRKSNKPHLIRGSPEILELRNSYYREEVVHIRYYFQRQCQNWIVLDGLKNKWWLWSSLIKEATNSMKYIYSYLEDKQKGKAVCIKKLCITPKEVEHRLGEFGHYCPVCLALHYHLMDCSESTDFTNVADYRGHYYRLCSEDHLETLLSTPDQFLAPECPHTLPPPHLLPKKLTESQVKNMFPKQAEMKGFCPVSYLDGKQRYEALVQGRMEYAVEYKDQIYFLESKQKQDRFLRTPETYWDQKLPNKIPPLCQSVSLTSLPTLGYLEQGVAVAVIKALTAAGCFKPKCPFLSAERSALLYVAFYLKAFNHKSTDYARQKYKKKLALFEENCALIPYLSSEMRGNFKLPSERPFDFEFKLKKFLELRVTNPSAFL